MGYFIEIMGKSNMFFLSGLFFFFLIFLRVEHHNMCNENAAESMHCIRIVRGLVLKNTVFFMVWKVLRVKCRLWDSYIFLGYGQFQNCILDHFGVHFTPGKYKILQRSKSIPKRKGLQLKNINSKPQKIKNYKN